MRASVDGDRDHTRLVTTVAWLYHTRQLRQSAIAARLGISQSRVSRLLDQAVTLGVVHTTVVLPETMGSALEAELEAAYHLTEAHVYDLGNDVTEDQLVSELGQLLALHLQTAPLEEEIIGFTSWSRSLQETVKLLEPLPQAQTHTVVEMLGDLGPPALQHQAAQVTERLARMTGATPMYLRTPGVTRNPQLRATMLDHDHHAQAVLKTLDELDLALVGIGTGRIVPPLQGGDNFFTAAQLDHVRDLGAVGELNLRFIDADGRPVVTELDDLVVGATLDQIRRARRRIAVAGGPSKYPAIRAALRGGWITSLLTDAATARYLLDHR